MVQWSFKEAAVKIPNFKSPTSMSAVRSPRSRGPWSSSPVVRYPSERGVALVITLILLSVITFMAVTFLVVTQAEKKSVVTKFDQDTSSQMADSAVEFAKIQILGPMLASNNTHTLSFLVSTNYFNPAGFVSGDPSWLNVNYDYKANGSAFTLDDIQQNESNLRYLPRPPVFVTNSVYGSNESRFYLDLNRNGRFDPTGMQTVTNANGLP